MAVVVVERNERERVAVVDVRRKKYEKKE